MRRKYTALFPFDAALWEDISHRTLAAFRQAFRRGPGTDLEVPELFLIVFVRDALDYSINYHYLCHIDKRE
jgi:hypothetical protein